MKNKALTPELRFIRGSEIRTIGEGKEKRIAGYAAVFNTNSQNLGGFIEVIRPGAFSRALREKQDVRCLFNHDANHVLGRSSSGTLTLREDQKGLYFECSLPDTQSARDVIALIDRGDVNGCSFRFSINHDGAKVGQKWTFNDGGNEPDTRELLDVNLYDVGPVTEPAYVETDVSLRSLEDAKAEHARARDAAKNPDRARRLRLAEAEVG